MPEAVTLSDDDLDPAKTSAPPLSASAPRRVNRAKAEKTKNDTPVQLKWPEKEVEALKLAAIKAKMTMSEYMLACFHAGMPKK